METTKLTIEFEHTVVNNDMIYNGGFVKDGFYLNTDEKGNETFYYYFDGATFYIGEKHTVLNLHKIVGLPQEPPKKTEKPAGTISEDFVLKMLAVAQGSVKPVEL